MKGIPAFLRDCVKLQALRSHERKGVLAIGYEHAQPQVALEPLWKNFELLAHEVMKVRLGGRVLARRTALIHPVHGQLIVADWEVLGRHSV